MNAFDWNNMMVSAERNENGFHYPSTDSGSYSRGEIYRKNMDTFYAHNDQYPSNYKYWD